VSTQLATQGYGGNQELATIGYGLVSDPPTQDDILDAINECCDILKAGQTAILAAIAALGVPSLVRNTTVTGGAGASAAAIEEIRRLLQLYRKELQERRFNNPTGGDRRPRGRGEGPRSR